MATVNDVTLKFILTDDGFFMILFYIILILLNKSRLYYRQIKQDNFGFFKYSNTYSAPSKSEQIFGFIKSLIGIFIYFILNTALVDLLIYQLKDTSTDAGFLLTILYVSFVVFPITLIAWDIRRLRIWPLINKEEIAANRQKELEYAEKMELYSNRKYRSEELGTMTGYEPIELEEIELVSNSLMRGEPGAGLSGSGFTQSNIKSGSLGELNFAKVLQKNDFLDKFATYWSVQYPFKYIPGPDSSSKGDIDCVLISNKNVFLIDLKLYTQGNLTWKPVNNGREVVSVDNITQNWIGEPRKMSKNMYHATKRIQEKLDKLGINMKVKPYVVMMPTNRGLGKVDNVFWPGKVECMTLIDFLKIVEKENPYDSHTADTEVLDSVFTWLTKNESGSAPRDGM